MNPTRACYKFPLSPQKPHPYGNGRAALGSVMRNLKENWSRCSEWRSSLEFDRTLKWRDSVPYVLYIYMHIYIERDRYYIYMIIYDYICIVIFGRNWGHLPKNFAQISRTTPMGVSAMPIVRLRLGTAGALGTLHIAGQIQMTSTIDELVPSQPQNVEMLKWWNLWNLFFGQLYPIYYRLL